MDLLGKTREELISLCKEKGIKGYSSKKKDEIILLLSESKSPSKKESLDPTNLNMIDLFAGTGAFTFAFRLKVNVVFANDMVESSKKIYDHNFDHTLTLGNLHDIKNEEIPSHDVLTGGFPCQAFSISGLRKGFDDERSNTFWKILSIADHHNPDV